ncbi:helix-turn-helix domain-containing protein [Streptomyces sp. NPDC051917]|uniref:helix-turn-helix domain-containing protein n=1 Tax=Streptomyces sp. NPDC051917 TaxID=3154754 RepID=UPI00344B7EED
MVTSSDTSSEAPQQAARQGPHGTDAVAVRLLEPLDSQPGLTATVAAFLDCDFDRRRTAQTLDVHLNTVDNRLARVTELTGVDPHTARGVQLFGVALTLHRIAGRHCR